MNLANYRGLISKILRDSSGKKLTPEQVADALITRITDAEEVISSMGGVVINGTPVPPVPLLPQPQASPAPIDLSRRVGAPEQVEAGLVERWTVEQLLDFAKNQMPGMLRVQPEGFDQPFEIQKFVEAAPAGIGFVRIVYQQPQAPITTENGQRVGPTLQIATTDAALDADALTDMVVQQAKSMYSKTPRVLTPKRGTAPSGPMGVELDTPETENLSSTMPVTGQMGALWQAQRRRDGS